MALQHDTPTDVGPCPACAGASPTEACPECGRTSGAIGRPPATLHTGKTLNLSAATSQGEVASAGTPELPTELSGRFETLGVLGRGGAGVVLRARDRLVGREVAIKLLGPGFARETKVLQSEAQHLAGLEHDRVVRLYEFGLAGESGYLVMELVRGETLWNRLARGRPPLLEGLAIGVDLFEGLAVAHGLGIVHADIKPLNLFVDAQGRIKIADFGLAKKVSEGRPLESPARPDAPTESKKGPGHSAKGPVVGTPGYMAPEQAEGHPAGPGADIYAAGVVLWETLTGQRMFTGRTSLALLIEQQRGPRHRVAELNPGVPAGLDTLVMRCLAKDPAQRPSAAELGPELAAWQDRLKRAARQPRAAGFPPHPYKFLDHFDADDAVIYFGRESEVAELAGILSTDNVRLLMVFGPCGVGKSSLLRAGLRRALDPAQFDVTTLIAGAEPAVLLSEALSRAKKLKSGSVPVLVLDQLEEVFTLNPGNSVPAAQLFEQVCELVERSDSPLKLVLGFRTEFRGQLFELERRLAQHTYHYSVGEMGAHALAEAIEGPSWIESYGFGYESGFARHLARDILATVQERGETAPPVLQIVCRQLFDRAKAEGVSTIGNALYERALGGARGALARYVEDRLDSPAYGQHAVLARQMLRALTVRGDAGERFARSREEAELQDFPDRAAARRTLEQLLADRLVVREQKAGGAIHVRLASEVICPLVEAWGPEVDEAERAARLLARTARQWIENGRRDEDLLVGGGLDLVARQHGSLREQDPSETELFRASLAARRRVRARMAFGAAMVGLFAVWIVWAAFLRPGQVTVKSEPTGAEVVREDGTTAGVTPLTFSDWPGTHQLTLRREHYADTPLTVRIPAGGAVSYWPLMPYPNGVLAVSTDPPGAHCEVVAHDGAGAPLAVTTPFYRELPVGVYTVKLAAAAYSPTQFDVEVAPNRMLTERVVRLERNTGYLAVSCPFPGTELTVRDTEGREVWNETLPASPRELAVGRYELEAGGPGHRRETRSVEITKGTTAQLTAWTPPVTRLASLQYAAAWSPEAVGDVDGDGRDDVIGVAGRSHVIARSPVGDRVIADVSLEPTFDVTERGRAAIVGVETADLNGDGRPDALCWCSPDSVAAVDLKAGTVLKTWSHVGTYTGTPPAAGDLDGDGASDVLVATVGGKLEAHSVKLGRMLWSTTLPSEIMTITTADLTGTGRADVVVTTEDDELRALSGKDGHPLWHRAMQLHTKGLMPGVTVAALSGHRARQLLWTDGTQLVAVDERGEQLWAQKLESKLSAGAYSEDSRMTGAGVLSTVDLDGDGRADPVVYGWGEIVALDGRDGSVRWRIADGRPRAWAAAGDFDGGGAVELAFHRDDSLIEVRGADGELRWTVKSAELRNSALQAVDWDGDGIKDLVHLDDHSQVVVDSGGFVPVNWAYRTAGPALVSPGVADLDGDGVPDVVTYSRVEDRGVVEAISGISGRQLWISHRAAPRTVSPVYADLDGDGVPDLVVPAPKGVVALSGRTGRPLWVGATRFAYVDGMTIADVDHDATPDVLVSGTSDQHGWKRQFCALSGATGRELWVSDELNSTAPHAPPVLRMDPKGVPEIVATLDVRAPPGSHDETPGAQSMRATTGTTEIYDTFLRLVSTTTGVVREFGKSYAPNALSSCVTGDFDGDGKKDVLAVAEDGSLFTYSSRTYEMYWEVDTDPSGQTYPRPMMGTVSVADVDGDGADDVLVAGGGRLFAISGRTSHPLWDRAFPDSPVLPVGLWWTGSGAPDLFAVTRGGSVMQIDGATGKSRGTLRMKAAQVGAPIIFDPRTRYPVTLDDMQCPRLKRAPVSDARVAWMHDPQTLMQARLSDLLPHAH